MMNRCEQFARSGPRDAKRGTRMGVAAVEFALVAPVFFLMVFGMIEYGRMIMVQQVLTNAAREGARLGVLEGSSEAQVSAAVTDTLSAAALAGAAVNISPSPLSSATYGSPVTISVSIPYSSVSWLPSPMYLNGTTLTAVATMRRESPQ